MKRILLLSLVTIAAMVTAQSEPRPNGENQTIKLIREVAPHPSRESWPLLPSLSTEVRQGAVFEINGSEEVRDAFSLLNAKTKRNLDWFEGVKQLEGLGAFRSLLVCLCHPSIDVQAKALRSLARLKEKRTVPFILIYAEYMAVHVEGSEEATIHAIIHRELASTLSSITGVEASIGRYQDPAGLKRAICQWRQWWCIVGDW